MPLLSTVGKKTWSQRFFVWGLYVTLSFFGATMAVPFLTMLTSSASNRFDYDRYAIVPRALWSAPDRFMKGTPYFAGPNGPLNLFPGGPVQWTSWRSVGLDSAGADRLAGRYLNVSEDERARWKVQSADYSDFALGYALEDTTMAFNTEQAAEFMLAHYVREVEARSPEIKALGRRDRERAALALLSERWGVPVTNYIAVRFERERRFPITQQSWMPPASAKWADYNALRYAVQHGVQTPGVLRAWESFLGNHGYSSGEIAALSPLTPGAPEKVQALWREFARTDAPLSPVIPQSLQAVWVDYLGSDNVRSLLKLGVHDHFDITRYNAIAGTRYASLGDTPFPLPAQGFDGLRPAWNQFIETQYPLRLLHLVVTDGLRARYREFLEANYKTVDGLNKILASGYRSWSEVPLAESLPAGRADDAPTLREVWVSFVKTLPAAERHPTSANEAWQDFLREKYGTLAALNVAYGWKLNLWEEADMPLDKAYAVTFGNHELAFSTAPALFNYRTILRFLMDQGNSIPVTVWLITLSILSSLTVNPLAGYALSRFNLKSRDKIILFCLATSAFPAMVSAIPGYLLMRDLGMLNTFFALVLPGAASGMSIFILKGFFDSLPQELYEAATIDGAREWQIFLFVTIPMVTPILAINALHAFIAAYDGWAWALIICQDKSMWTLSVWLYQANSWWSASPWITTAGFVITSIPTLIVFLCCQKIIMRGIIVPSMK